MRIGIFGGTFDPPHVGHLIAAQDAYSALGLDRLLFVPAAVPPHKQGVVSTPAEARLEMLRAAVAGDPRFEVDDVELRRPGPSYTVDTLRELRRRDPSAALTLLMGVDQFRDLHTWREPLEIARLAEVVVLTRAGVADVGTPLDIPYRLVPVTRVDLSATEIRRRVAAGEPIRYLVPAAVESIIVREGFYRGAAGAAR